MAERRPALALVAALALGTPGARAAASVTLPYELPELGGMAMRGVTIGPIESALHPGRGYGSPAFERGLEPSVGEVPDEPAHPEPLGLVPAVPPVPHALDPTRHHHADPLPRRVRAQLWHWGQKYVVLPWKRSLSIGVRQRRHGFPSRS